MIVYHFTSNVLLPRIRNQGLTKGAVPWRIGKTGQVQMMRQVQWLTVDPEFDSQAWENKRKGMAAAMMRKTDWRIEVHIPNHAALYLWRWKDFAARHNLPVVDYFNTIKGNQHWRIFTGAITPLWFEDFAVNPTLRSLPDPTEN
jgi:hypothetical protein